MFPEGTINRSFVPGRGHSGTARMAMRGGAPIVPCGVWGSQRILTKGRDRNLQRGVVVDVAYGEPLVPAEGDDPGAVTEQLMGRILDLVERLQAAYPQQPDGDDDRWWLPAHLGGTAPTPEEAAEEAREAAVARRRRRAEERRSS